MSVELKPATNDENVLTAIAEQMQRHDLRLRAGQTLEQVVADMGAKGLTFSVDHSTLVGVIGGQPANLPQCFENFAKANVDRFYPRGAEVGNVKCRDAMDRKAKIEFLKSHSLAEFEALPQHEPVALPVEMSPRSMSREQYQSLSRSQKADFIKQFGPDAVGTVMARRSKTK